jgi:surfeit locus 1 family protein
MAPALNFSWKTTITCTILAALMVRASFWQHSRLLQKNAYITQLEERLKEPPVALTSLLEEIKKGELPALIHKRVLVRGTYDFTHQMILRNRRYHNIPGALLITPLRIDGTNVSILVNRGFIPLKDSYSLERFNTEPQASFTGLLKENMHKKFLAPSDPEISPGGPFQVQWIRVNIPQIQKQIPYDVLPMWLEVMEQNASTSEIKKNIVSESTAGREDMLFLPGNQDKKVLSDADVPELSYPVPSYDTVIPPGRHQ